MDVDFSREVERLLTERRSTRAFEATHVDRDLIERILTAASRAPSGTNMQPWRVYVVTGEAREALSAQVLAMRGHEPERERGPRPYGEYVYNPEPLPEPYQSRRRTVGWGLYEILGVAKGDREASWREAGRNFEFFGAPVGLIFTLDRILERGSWLDLGMFLQSIMVAARGHGLETCCQAAWRHYHDVVRSIVGIPDEEVLVCGMSMGFAAKDAPANRLRSEREPLSGFARFVDRPVPAPTSTATGRLDTAAP